MAGKSAAPAAKTKGERVGQPAGPDVDSSFHVYEFEEVEPGAVEAPPAPASEPSS